MVVLGGDVAVAVGRDAEGVAGAGAPAEWPPQEATTSAAAARHETARTARDRTEGHAAPCGTASASAMMQA